MTFKGNLTSLLIYPLPLTPTRQMNNFSTIYMKQQQEAIAVNERGRHTGLNSPRPHGTCIANLFFIT